ncbi:MAG TPA: PIN domain-containing protein [Candidatus Bathyarchaeia archaeon]|nr:PIN domain-containing protein [Candidatus Bathyarchaeia archaeon]
MSPPQTVDTRFFLTHFLAHTDSLRDRSRRKITELQRQNAIVPTIVVHEVYKYEYEESGVEVANLRIDSILRSSFRIIDLSTPIAITAATLRARHRGLPTADAIIAATALHQKARRIVSDDPHFSRIEGLTTEWL